jgi:hydrogenase-1 operon protein HyaF
MHEPRPFPIPVTALFGPGSQAEEEVIDFMPMPKDMATYRPPVLPEPQVLAAQQGALAVLREALATMRRSLAGQAVQPLVLRELGDADRALVNQVLGEGEVAAQVTGDGAVQAQESVFAGVWRVLHGSGADTVDTLEIGGFPQAVAAAALADGRPLRALAPEHADGLPTGTMNAPALLAELRDRAARWQPGVPAHVVNLSLLPLTPGDSELLERELGRGRVMVLSRGYGNCRVVNTQAAHIWRVTYFNSQDMIILDTLEVGPVPEVCCAAPQDLEDSAERLAEVLQWVEQA